MFSKSNESQRERNRMEQSNKAYMVKPSTGVQTYKELVAQFDAWHKNVNSFPFPCEIFGD